MAKSKNTEQVVTAASTVADSTPKTYVVVRDGYRVSNKEYLTPDDATALAECSFWTLVSNKHSWGERTEIVEYDPRRHRVW